MIGIVGYGVVGKCTEMVLIPDKNIIIHEVLHKTKLQDVFTCDLIFICIPTRNKIDIGNLKQICIEIANNNPKSEVVIRSTVTPGFFKNLEKEVNIHLTYLPEFLRERYAIEDSLNCETLLYSTNAPTSKLTTFERFNYKLKKIEFEELEIIKMMLNNYHAMKVVFANHYYDLCQKYDANYDNILNAFNIVKNDQSYLEVNQNLRGYGGKCLPKDLDFMINEFGEGVDLFKSIKKDNSNWITTVRQDTLQNDENLKHI